LGINKKLSEIAVEESKRPSVIAQSLAAGSTKSNPREPSAADLEAILTALSR
jgi:alcohol dehydrogenase class IV